MTLADLPWDGASPATRNGAKGAKPCRRHSWEWTDWMENDSRVIVQVEWCARCHKRRDPIASRRGRTNRSRGNRAELAVARMIPGARKMGPLGLPWDVEVGTYCRLQVKKLSHRPSLAEIARLIRAIPDSREGPGDDRMVFGCGRAAMTRQPHVSRAPWRPPEQAPERIGWRDVIALVGCVLVAVAFVLLWVGQGAP